MGHEIRTRARENKLEEIVQRDSAQHGTQNQPGYRRPLSQEQIPCNGKCQEADDDRPAETGYISSHYLKPGGAHESGWIGGVVQGQHDVLIEPQRLFFAHLLGDEAEYKKKGCYRQNRNQEPSLRTSLAGKSLPGIFIPLALSTWHYVTVRQANPVSWLLPASIRSRSPRMATSSQC